MQAPHISLLILGARPSCPQFREVEDRFIPPTVAEQIPRQIAGGVGGDSLQGLKAMRTWEFWRAGLNNEK